MSDQPSYGAPLPPPPPPGYEMPLGYGQPMTAPPGMYFDPASNLMLPQGVVLASVGRRIGAWALGVVLAIVTLGIGYIIWGAILWSKGTSS